MTIRLVSGAFVETIVTLAVAALLTLAGFEMLEGAGMMALPSVAANPPTTATRPDVRQPATGPCIAMPHVDSSHG